MAKLIFRTTRRAVALIIAIRRVASSVTLQKPVQLKINLCISWQTTYFEKKEENFSWLGSQCRFFIDLWSATSVKDTSRGRGYNHFLSWAEFEPTEKGMRSNLSNLGGMEQQRNSTSEESSCSWLLLTQAVMSLLQLFKMCKRQWKSARAPRKYKRMTLGVYNFTWFQIYGFISLTFK